MRKVVLNVAVTLDGFIEGPNGEYDWCFTDGEYGMNEFLAAIDAIFFGRKSYELWSASFSQMWTDKEHYVFSNTLQQLPTSAILLNGGIENKVAEIKQQPGKDIWLFGGTSLTTSLMNAALIDEMSIAIHPIILGGGKLLFSNILQKTELVLLNCTPYPSGLVQNRYRVLA